MDAFLAVQYKTATSRTAPRLTRVCSVMTEKKWTRTTGQK